MLLLAINTDSFHHKYYQTLRTIWGFDNNSTKRTNLCSYAHFLFWFSLLTLTVSPLILSGWLLLKIGRLLYKICSLMPLGKTLIDTLDKIGLGDVIDELSDKMVEHPATTLIKTFVGFFISAAMILFILALIFGGILYIKTVFINVLAVIVMLGLGVFYTSAGIGWVVSSALALCLSIIKCTILFLTGAVYFLMIGMLLAIMICLLGAILIKIFAASTTLSNFFNFKINGYHKARKENAKRRVELEEQHKKEMEKRRDEREKILIQKSLGELPYTLWEKIVMGIIKILKTIFTGLYNFFVARTKNVKGGSVKVMGVFGIFVETLKSIKHGICPFVDFVSNDDFVEDKVEEN